METKLINTTDKVQRYAWVPKHGITLQAGESITIKGPLKAKRPRSRKSMEADIANGRITVITDMGNESPVEKEIPVKQPEAPKKKEKPAAKKNMIEEVTSLADAVIEVENKPVEADNVPGVEIADEFEEPEVFDIRGEKIEEEPAIEINSVHDIDDDDILAKTASEKKKVTIPSKSAIKKMTVAKVREVARALGIDVDDTMTKKELTALIDGLR